MNIKLMNLLAAALLFGTACNNTSKHSKEHTTSAATDMDKYKDVRAELEHIGEQDQKWRLLDIELSKQTSIDKNSKEYKALVDSFDYTDSVNLVYVDKILKEHGWLSVEQVGSKANLAIFMVVQHADLDYQLSVWEAIASSYRKCVF